MQRALHSGQNGFKKGARISQKLALALGSFFLAGLCAALILIVKNQGNSVRQITDAQRKDLEERLDSDPDNIYQYDENLGYRLKPNFTGIRHGTERANHETNSRGLLGTNEPDQAVAPLVLILGDSVSYGDMLPYNQIFSSVLQAEVGSNFSVYNASCSGWSTHQEIQYFKRYLADLSWDAVYLIFCLNDVIKYEWTFDPQKGKPQMSEEVQADGGFSSVTRSIASLELSRIRRHFRNSQALLPLSFQNNSLLKAWVREVWDQFEKDELMQIANDPQLTNLVVVAVPSVMQLLALKGNAPPQEALFPQRQLEAFCATNTIPFIDTTPYLLKQPIGTNLFLDQMHLGGLGHRVMANILREDLGKRFANSARDVCVP